MLKELGKEYHKIKWKVKEICGERQVALWGQLSRAVIPLTDGDKADRVLKAIVNLALRCVH